MRPTLQPFAGFAAVLTIILQPASAYSASVTGTFVEKGGGTPLAAVEVVLRRATDSTVVAHTASGADGRFRLDSLRFDRYLLRASLLGHVSLVRRDVVLTESAPLLDLGTNPLAVSPIAIKGVSVSTERATAIVAPDRNIYLTKDQPVASAGTAADFLRTVPELDVDINGNVSLRGSSSVKIQFNGRAAPLQGDALAAYLRQMPASRIERAEVIANPSAKYDPEGTGGIVNIVLKDNVDLGLSGNVNLTAGNSWSGPGARVAWQQGPVTLFGGLSGYLGRGRYGSEMTRRDLLTLPAGFFSSSSASEYKSGYGMGDASIDYALTKRSTVYGTVNGYWNANDTDVLTHVIVADSTQMATTCYDRTDAGSSDGHMTSYTLGFQNVVQQGKDERTVEFLQSDSHNGNDSHGLQHTLVPLGVEDQISRQADASGGHLDPDLLYDRVLPFYEQLGVQVGAALTDNGREYCGRPDSHPYELLLGMEEIEHRTTKIRSPRTNGFVERMNRTLLDECFRVTGRTTWYLAPEEIQRDLDRFLAYYTSDGTGRE